MAQTVASPTARLVYFTGNTWKGVPPLVASGSNSPLRLALLALLADEPNSGYGLGRAFATQRNHVWSARTQQIYSDLAQLESAQMVMARTQSQG